MEEIRGTVYILLLACITKFQKILISNVIGHITKLVRVKNASKTSHWCPLLKVKSSPTNTKSDYQRALFFCCLVVRLEHLVYHTVARKPLDCK